MNILSVFLSVCLSVFLSDLSVCLSVCLSFFLNYFRLRKKLFDLTLVAVTSGSLTTVNLVNSGSQQCNMNILKLFSTYDIYTCNESGHV